MYVGSRCIDRPDVKAEAAIRSHRGRFSRTNKPLAEGADNKNYCAQLAVCELFTLSPDVIPSRVTKGWDFEINGHKIKVMGAQVGGNLAIKERKRPSWADVYILCWIIDGEPHVIRWCEKEQVATAPVTTLTYTGSYTQPTHKVSYTALSRDLHALKVRLGLAYGQEGFW